jgi:hypothetical protein
VGTGFVANVIFVREGVELQQATHTGNARWMQGDATRSIIAPAYSVNQHFIALFRY